MAAYTSDISDVLLQIIEERALKWIADDQKKELNILITGKSGIGKSRLVNALVGTDVAKEGKRDSCTNYVTPYEAFIKGVHVRVWDSPGLQDGTCDEELYLANLKAADSKHGFHIVLYCFKMDDKRFYSEDKKAIEKLTEGFGKDLWKKTVIALTFANKIQDPDQGDEQTYFQDELTKWERQIREKLDEVDIDSKTLDTLPIVPVGNYKQGFCLPTSTDWFTELWLSCHCVMGHSSAKTWYSMNKHRMRNPRLKNLAVSINSISDSSQIYKPRFRDPRVKAPAVGISCISDSSQRDDQSSDDPEITFTDEQEDRFWKKMWEGFKEYAAGISSLSAVAGLGFTIFKLIWK